MWRFCFSIHATYIRRYSGRDNIDLQILMDSQGCRTLQHPNVWELCDYKNNRICYFDKFTNSQRPLIWKKAILECHMCVCVSFSPDVTFARASTAGRILIILVTKESSYFTHQRIWPFQLQEHGPYYETKTVWLLSEERDSGKISVVYAYHRPG